MENLVYSLFDYFDKFPFIVSFIAGILSFFSPCVLPLVPIYFFYITGISAKELENRTLSKKERLKIFFNSVSFIAGFALVFVLIGVVSANLIGNIFAYKWVNIVLGVIIVLFGLHVGGFVKFNFLQYEKRLNIQNAGSFLLGFSFAFGWTPCIGPIYGTIVGMALVEPAKSFIMMFLYVFGLALPFILLSVFTISAMKIIEKLKKYIGVIEKVSGIVLILVGVYVIYKSLM